MILLFKALIFLKHENLWGLNNFYIYHPSIIYINVLLYILTNVNLIFKYIFMESAIIE